MWIVYEAGSKSWQEAAKLLLEETLHSYKFTLPIHRKTTLAARQKQRPNSTSNKHIINQFPEAGSGQKLHGKI